MGLTIGITCDLRSDYLAMGYSAEDVGEFDSDPTIDAIEGAIRSLGHSPRRIGHAKELCRRLVAGEKWDLVFNICEGLQGRSREAQAPAILELYGVPYVFSDPLVCALTLDKAMAKKIVRAAGIATPADWLIESRRDITLVDGGFPLFVKPVADGTGKGIDAGSIVRSRSALATRCELLLRRFHQPVLVEEYLPGREFTVGILGTGHRARVIGTMEIEVLPSTARGVYSFEAKEKCEEQVRYSRPRDRKLRKAVEELALWSYLALECRDAGRVDIKLDTKGRPCFMELNPLPGLHPHHSDLPMIATQEGMSYRSLIGAIIKSALARRRST